MKISTDVSKRKFKVIHFPVTNLLCAGMKKYFFINFKIYDFDLRDSLNIK